MIDRAWAELTDAEREQAIEDDRQRLAERYPWIAEEADESYPSRDASPPVDTDATEGL